MARNTPPPTLEERSRAADTLATNAVELFQAAANHLDTAAQQQALIAGEARDKAAELEHTASVAEHNGNAYAVRASKLRDLLGLS